MRLPLFLVISVSSLLAIYLFYIKISNNSVILHHQKKKKSVHTTQPTIKIFLLFIIDGNLGIAILFLNAFYFN